MSDTRNIVLLSGAQAVAGSAQGMVMAVAALAAASLAADPALATVPTTVMIVGLALMAGPAALLLHKLGRTRGFVAGTGLTIAGGLIAALALVTGSFLLFCAGMMLLGAGAAFGQQYRFAAADSVSAAMRPRAVSFVLLGGVLAAFLGPRLGNAASGWIADAPYAGSFLGLAGLGVVSALVLSATRLARADAGDTGGGRGRAFTELVRTPEIFVPVLTAMASYALMTFVMVAAPLAMVVICGHSTAAAADAIQWHMLAMFAPSFVTGSIIKRIGPHLTVAIGLVLILGSALVALAGTTTLHFDLGLVLLGVGWNFGFIGSTVMLADGYRPEESARVQALNEQLVFGVMALASIGAGVLLNAFGWEAVNMIVPPAVAAMLVLLAWADMRGRRARRSQRPRNLEA